jgi:hypothetical protein
MKQPMIGRLVGSEFLDRLAPAGAFLLAGTCPACFPLLATAGAALGLGFLRSYQGMLLVVFQILVGFSVLGNILAFRSHRKWQPLAMSAAGAGLVFLSLYVLGNEWLVYLGLASLSLAAVWNAWLKSRMKTCGCEEPVLAPRGGLALQAHLRCPRCGHGKEETMPEASCVYFYRCEGCGTVLKPREGDCCVFCSYADVPCPPKQKERKTATG